MNKKGLWYRYPPPHLGRFVIGITRINLYRNFPTYMLLIPRFA